MRRFTTKELAAATSQSETTVRVHINRGLLFREEDGLIDIDTEKSKRYINEKTKGAGLFSVQEKEVVSKKEPEKEVKPKVKTADERFYIDLDRRKKQAEVEVVERNAELKRIEMEKKAGNLLPVDVVEKIFIINTQAIFKSFEGELENISSVACGGNRELLASITKQVREILHQLIRKANQDSKIEIDNCIFDLQDVRGRGERK